MTTTMSPPARFTLPDFPEYDAIPADPACDRDRRIASVVPLLTRTINRLLWSAPARVRRQLNAADCLQECWAILADRDHYFDPARSSYPNFALMIVGQHLRRTIGVMDRTSLKVDPGVDAETIVDVGADQPDAEIMSREDALAAREAIKAGLDVLSDMKAFVIQSTYGVLGGKLRTPTEQGAWLCLDPTWTTRRIANARREAEEELRQILAPFAEAV